MGSKVGKILKAVAPAALSYFGAPYLGAALGGGAGSGTLSGALLGGLGSAATGGNPITGAVTGGLGANIGDIGKGIGLTGPNSLLGETASNLQGPTTSGASLGSGSGILGNLTGSAAGGGASSFGGGNLLSNVLSAGLGTSANADAEEELLRAQQQAAGKLGEFENTSFTPDDLQNDAGYQFQLGQGEQALARKQAAGGNYFSGQALKEAQDYGTGLASKYYDQALGNFNANRNFNYGVAKDQAGILGNRGNVKANAGVTQNNILSNALSSIIGGGSQNRVITGYDPQTGQPIYG